jgi:hypothetical protein
MHALSGPTFDFADLSSEDQCVALPRDVHRGRHKLIVRLYLISAPVATMAWLAGLVWAAIKMVEFAVS